jgi:hypothetical protein
MQWWLRDRMRRLAQPRFAFLVRYRLSICVQIVSLLMALDFVHERKCLGY